MLLGKISVNTYTQQEALKAIELLVRANNGGMVFTPNVDHVVLAEDDESFAKAYNNANICLADGMPIVWASYFLGNKILERVSGSDLLLPLMRRAYENDWSVYFLGSSEAVLKKTIRKLSDKFPSFNIVGHLSPIVSANPSWTEVELIVKNIAQLKPQLIIVCLGAPKQELFINKAIGFLPNSVMLGLGASCDFFVGDIKRAPKLMQRVGLEWLYRFIQEPRRLFKRYFRDLQFPLIVYKQYKNNKK